MALQPDTVYRVVYSPTESAYVVANPNDPKGYTFERSMKRVHLFFPNTRNSGLVIVSDTEFLDLINS